MGRLYQPDLFAARENRDKAIASVSNNAGNEWMVKALDVISSLKGEATGESIRILVEPRIGKPHHHNAWGAVVRTAIKRGFITFANRYEQMKTSKSHARRTPVYYCNGK
jgi:hypothetical protein